MIRSTTFDTKYMVVNEQRYIVCTAYNLEKVNNFLHDKDKDKFTLLVRHFDIDKCGMRIVEYDSRGNILDNNFLSFSKYGNAIWDMV